MILDFIARKSTDTDVPNEITVIVSIDTSLLNLGLPPYSILRFV